MNRSRASRTGSYGSLRKAAGTVPADGTSTPCAASMRSRARTGPLHLPYRPTRNPGAFLAMVFDLAGAVIHGYLARIDGGAEHTGDAVGGVRQRLGERLSAPWSRFAAELHGAGFEGLAALVCETAWQALHRPAVSDLPALLAEVRGSMTTSQWARFDADQYVRELPFHRVLTLLRYQGEHDVTAGTRELHPAGGDLRALVRRRLDAPWRLALERRAHSDPIAFVASWPVDVGWLADQARRPRTSRSPHDRHRREPPGPFLGGPATLRGRRRP